jgi:hypothetical protein
MFLVRKMEVNSRNVEHNKNYRIMIDSERTGHVRILRRINLKTLMDIFKDLYLELKLNSEKPHMIIYLSPSIYDEMSDNMKHFHNFAASCMDGTFELIVIS